MNLEFIGLYLEPRALRTNWRLERTADFTRGFVGLLRVAHERRLSLTFFVTGVFTEVIVAEPDELPNIQGFVQAA